MLENSNNQRQTANMFSYKWHQVHSYRDSGLRNLWGNWLKEKYLTGNQQLLEEIFDSDKVRMLDAGCGAGISSLLLFGDYLRKADYIGVDISDSIELAKIEFNELDLQGTFIQSDLFELDKEFVNFDLIFSEGVLHHTPSVERGIKFLAERLSKDGFLLFYVYKKKAPIREWTDDFIRNQVSDLEPDQAWEALEGLTEFGISLGELNAQIEVKKDLPILGIVAGKYDLQRLFYYVFMKAFYSPDLSFEEMHHVNYDWYSPKYCWRHTPEDIESFCINSGLTVKQLHVDDSGISVVAKKL